MHIGFTIRASVHESGILMLKHVYAQGFSHDRGFSMIEVLVTIVILAFGLLGLAGMQTRIQASEVESYQRAQAIILLAEMTERISANRANAATYVTSSAIGAGDSIGATCATTPGANADLCEWSNALKGASEALGSQKTGGMVAARGCIQQIQAPNPAAGICIPGIYGVTVTWQGLQPTASPADNCGRGAYGSNDAYRRVISTAVTVGLPLCS